MKTSRIKAWIKNTPHSLALCYFLVYLPSFAALEVLVTPRYVIHLAIDDFIPFCEWFIFPYYFWMLWMPASLLFFLWKSKTDFQNLCFLMFTGMTACLLLYAIFPNAVDLRREITGSNLPCRLVGLLRAIDTPTNVCPSLHISTTAAIGMVIRRSALFRGRGGVKAACFTAEALIYLSTLLLQQHSVVDVACGWLLSTLLCRITYHTNWREVLGRTPLRILRSNTNSRLKSQEAERMHSM